MRSIIQHLRFPFSYLLLPVFLLGLFQITKNHVPTEEVLLFFFILHFLIYPSSNAYNSYQDRDTESIGLVKNPLVVSRKLLYISVLFDIIGILLASYISLGTAFYITIYVAISRLYSYRKVRLKKHPILGFLVVFIFQGAWIYIATVHTFIGIDFTSLSSWLYYVLTSSFLIGSVYPLSQIYQHAQDKADGVITISYLLGKRGTFIFSGCLFLAGSSILLFKLYWTGYAYSILPYLAFQLPSLIYFNYWFYKVIKDEREANFTHTMRMSLISATCMNAFFLFLIFT